MKKQVLREILRAIIDRRLFGLGTFFLCSGPLLAVGFVIQVIIYLSFNRLLLYIYVPSFVFLVLVSGLASKNFASREVNNMGHFRCFLFMIASVLASLAPFAVNLPEDPLMATYQFSLLYIIYTLSLTMAVVEVTVYGQRISLRNHMQLTDDYLKKQRKIWKEKLEKFPNSENIIKGIDDSRAVATLFDRGSFSLAVLWSCNVMEQVIDAVADGIISRNPKKRELFKKQDNSPLRYPKQLQNLGFKLALEKNKKEEQITTEILWHEIRKNVAHYNYRPTFQQTYGAIYILISFITEMPDILQDWR
jgi:hypothetical protein